MRCEMWKMKQFCLKLEQTKQEQKRRKKQWILFGSSQYNKSMYYINHIEMHYHKTKGKNKKCKQNKRERKEKIK